MNNLSGTDINTIELSTKITSVEKINNYLSDNYMLKSSGNKIQEEIEFLNACNKLNNSIVIKEQSAYFYYDNKQISNFNSLKDALSSIIDKNNDYYLSNFNGYIYFLDDYIWNESQKISCNSQLDLIFDFQNNIITNTSLIAVENISLSGSVTFRNGKFILKNNNETTDSKKIWLHRGDLNFKNIDIVYDTNNLNNLNVLVRINGVTSLGELSTTGIPTVSFDKKSNVQIKNVVNATGIQIFSSYFRLKTNGVKCPKDNKIISYNDRYGDQIGHYKCPQCNSEFTILSGIPSNTTYEQYLSDYANDIPHNPHINIDCKFTLESNDNDEVEESLLTDNNGSDKEISYLTIGENAIIQTSGKHGIYTGADMFIQLNGGKIVGGNGITMRSGTLYIPAESNPTIIGFANYQEYDPRHTIKHGSDAGNNLMLGHAICLESNGTSYGGKFVSADIESGNFISYENCPIAYYSAAISVHLSDENTYNEFQEPNIKYTYDDNMICHFYKRSHLSDFVKGGTFNRYSYDDEYGKYVFNNGKYPSSGNVNNTTHIFKNGNVYKKINYIDN